MKRKLRLRMATCLSDLVFQSSSITMSSMKLGIKIRFTKRAEKEAIYVVVDSLEKRGIFMSYLFMKSVLMLMNMTGVTKMIDAKSRNTHRIADLVLLNSESRV